MILAFISSDNVTAMHIIFILMALISGYCLYRSIRQKYVLGYFVNGWTFAICLWFIAEWIFKLGDGNPF